MKYFLLSLIALAFLVVPQFAYAGCTQQTLFINGRMIVCTVCYDEEGRPTHTVCM